MCVIARSPVVAPYTIERTRDPPPLDGTIADTPWERATEARIAYYPWADAPDRPPATVRVLYDDTTLYCQFHVHETDLRARETDRNGDVWTDSAVEWFFDPSPDEPEYYNLESNCIGTILLSWRTVDGVERWLDAEAATDVRVETSVAGSPPCSTAEEGWWLAAATPFSVLADLAGEPVAPEAGDRWRGNFHQIDRGESGPIAVWHPIESDRRDLHRPEYYGELRFE